MAGFLQKVAFNPMSVPGAPTGMIPFSAPFAQQAYAKGLNRGLLEYLKTKNQTQVSPETYVPPMPPQITQGKESPGDANAGDPSQVQDNQSKSLQSSQSMDPSLVPDPALALNDPNSLLAMNQNAQQQDLMSQLMRAFQMAMSQNSASGGNS